MTTDDIKTAAQLDDAERKHDALRSRSRTAALQRVRTFINSINPKHVESDYDAGYEAACDLILEHIETGRVLLADS